MAVAVGDVRYASADSIGRRNTLPLYLARRNGMQMEGHADVGHAEAKGKALRALEERPMGGRCCPLGGIDLGDDARRRPRRRQQSEPYRRGEAV